MNDRRYTKDHEWIELQGDTGVVGITDYAQEQLGDVVFVELPDVGQNLTKSNELGVVESVKAASDIYSPVRGEVLEINEKLLDEPEIINNSPYEDGWLFKIQPDDIESIKNLLTAEEYTNSQES